jgi:hypothetical protein
VQGCSTRDRQALPQQASLSLKVLHSPTRLARDIRCLRTATAPQWPLPRGPVA